MKEIIKKIITEWFERKLPDLIERDIPFKLTKDVMAVIGPRRVGKTYFMFQIIKKLLNKVPKEEILFIDFEDNRLANLKADQLDDIFVAYAEISRYKLKYLFFDEVQAISQWSRFVRRLHSTQKYAIVISGSSSKLLSREIATELRGRYKTVFIAPFSFQEFLQIRKFEYSTRIAYSENKGKLLALFNEYLIHGGYPEIVKESDLAEKRAKVKSYYDTIFYKDIVERHKIANYDMLELLMNYLLDNTASVFSVTQFEKILKEKGLGISKKTISLYLKYLEEAFFTYVLEEFSYSAKKRLMRPKKTYVVDNALITFLSANFSPDKGKLLENLCLTELKNHAKDVFYFKGVHECDFLVKEGIKIKEAIQVCYELTSANKEREFKGLLAAMSYFGLEEGLILTYDQEESVSREGKKIKLVPVWKWLLHKNIIGR